MLLALDPQSRQMVNSMEHGCKQAHGSGELEVIFSITHENSNNTGSDAQVQCMKSDLGMATHIGYQESVGLQAANLKNFSDIQDINTPQRSFHVANKVELDAKVLHSWDAVYKVITEKDNQHQRKVWR